MKVIFVGIHNKDGRKPLCGYTKTGKLIDRVIKGIKCDSLKTNLYNVDYMPIGTQMKWEMAREWQERTEVDADDIIILLGQHVHLHFITLNLATTAIIRAPHPASKRSHVAMDEYVKKMVEAINESIS